MYHQKYYKLIGIDLSIQTNINIPEQLNFPGKLEDDDDLGAMLFIAKKQQKTILNYCLSSLIVT